MVIETKFNIGEVVFFSGYGGDWCRSRIRGVLFIDNEVMYLMEERAVKERVYAIYVKEDEVFLTKEELLKSL